MGTWHWRVGFVTGLSKRLHLRQIACMLPRELKCLWNEQVPPGVKFKVVREHSFVIQDHKPTLYI